jgi:tripartite ATP-independent transporter DctP family solute receptor
MNGSMATIMKGFMIWGCISVALSGMQVEAAATANYNLRFGHVTATDFVYHIAAEQFAKQVAEKSSGKINIAIFPNSQLGNEQTLADSLTLGTLDFAIVNQAYTSSYVPQFGFLSVSYLFADNSHVERVMFDQQFVGMLNKFTENKNPGFVYLATLPSGVRSIYSTIPIKAFDELKGYKLRIMPSEIESKVWKTLGTQPVSVPYGEVYSALQSKLAQGAENTPSAYYTAKHNEVAKYYVLTEHQYLTANILASKKLMSSMPAEYVMIIRQAALDACKAGSKYAVESDAKVLETLGKEGVNVSPIDKSPFIKAISPLHQQIAADMKCQDLYMRIKELEK